jgi:hypothetical protein
MDLWRDYEGGLEGLSTKITRATKKTVGGTALRAAWIE